jgi:hypothetical protein
MTIPVTRAETLGKIGQAVWQSVSQDASLLKESSAFWATMIHTALRLFVAADSARRPAPTPEDKKYNERAAAMTFFLEIVGVSLGWGVLKAGENLLSAQMDKHLGFEIVKPGVLGPGKALKLAFQALIDPTKVVVPHVPEAVTGLKYWQRTANHVAPTGWMKNLLVTVGHYANTHWAEEDRMLHDVEMRGYKALRNNLPKLISSPFAIGLAGWWLQRTTLMHGDQIIDTMLGLDANGNKMAMKDRIKSIGGSLPALAGFGPAVHKPVPVAASAATFGSTVAKASPAIPAPVIQGIPMDVFGSKHLSSELSQPPQAGNSAALSQPLAARPLGIPAYQLPARMAPMATASVLPV